MAIHTIRPMIFAEPKNTRIFAWVVVDLGCAFSVFVVNTSNCGCGEEIIYFSSNKMDR